jgi:hypothetical protein
LQQRLVGGAGETGARATENKKRNEKREFLKFKNKNKNGLWQS